ncbi:MAG: hypothetical protein R3A13_01850 [Bdellovibrionota bacterium]
MSLFKDNLLVQESYSETGSELLRMLFGGDKEMPSEQSLQRRNPHIQFEYEIVDGKLMINGVSLEELLTPPPGRESNFMPLDNAIKEQLLKIQDIFVNNADVTQALIASNRAMFPPSDRNYLYEYRRSATNPNLIECVAIEHPGTPEEFRDFYERLIKSANHKIPGDLIGLDPAAVFEKGNLIESKTIFELARDSLKNNSDYQKVNNYLDDLYENLQNAAAFREAERKLIKELADKFEQAIIDRGVAGIDDILNRFREELNVKGTALHDAITEIFERSSTELNSVLAEISKMAGTQTYETQTSSKESRSASFDISRIEDKQQIDASPRNFNLNERVAELQKSIEPHDMTKTKLAQTQAVDQNESLIPKRIEPEQVQPRQMTREEFATREAQIKREQELREKVVESAERQANSEQKQPLNLETARNAHPHEIIQANLALVKRDIEQAASNLKTASDLYNNITTSRLGDLAFANSFDKAPKLEIDLNEIQLNASREFAGQNIAVELEANTPQFNLDFLLNSKKQSTKDKQVSTQKLRFIQRVIEQVKKSVPVRLMALAFLALPLGVRSVLYNLTRPISVSARFLGRSLQNTLNFAHRSLKSIVKALISFPKRATKTFITLLKNLAPTKLLRTISSVAVLTAKSFKNIITGIREIIKNTSKRIFDTLSNIAKQINKISAGILKALNSTRLGSLFTKAIGLTTYYPRKAVKAIFSLLRATLSKILDINNKRTQPKNAILRALLKPIDLLANFVIAIFIHPLALIFGVRPKTLKTAAIKKAKNLKRKELLDQLLIILMKRAFLNTKNADEARKQMIKEKLKRLLYLSKEELAEFIQMAGLNEQETKLLIEVLKMYNREIPRKYL